jgi:hypothetical protein
MIVPRLSHRWRTYDCDFVSGHGEHFDSGEDMNLGIPQVSIFLHL